MALDQLDALARRHMLEQDIRRALRQFESTEDVSVGLRPQMCIERLARLETLNQHDLVIGSVFFVDVAAGATRFHPHPSLDRFQNLDDFASSVRQWQDS